jgi:hypothetical protein
MVSLSPTGTTITLLATNPMPKGKFYASTNRGLSISTDSGIYGEKLTSIGRKNIPYNLLGLLQLDPNLVYCSYDLASFWLTVTLTIEF